MSWSAEAERGSALLTRAGLALVQGFGWPAGRVIASASAAWFLLRSPTARRASADYLQRILGRPATWADVARHFDQFASGVLDRVLLLSGRDALYAIEVDGLEKLLAVLEEGRGAILLGAHLGSFEVLRTLARRAPVPVWALMYRRNAGALTALLDRLAPHLRDRIIEIGDTASLIRARECVERGEIVGILADRAPEGHRSVPAAFLGGTAHFPAGPFVLAATLAAPVFLCHAVRVGKRRYRIGMAPFADRVVLRRSQREADLRRVVACYADSIAELCRAYPFQWFNFFPFWESPYFEAHDAPSGPANPRAAPAARLRSARPG